MIFLVLDIFVLSLIVVIFIIFYKQILEILDDICDEVRAFIYRNESFFSLVFLFIFFLEQLILVLLVFYFGLKRINLLPLTISVFALIVVTTASMQKTILEARIKYLKEQNFAVRKLSFYIDYILDRYGLISKKK